MLDQDPSDQEMLILATHRRRLKYRLQQRARLGELTPPDVALDIEDEQRAIRQIKTALRARGVSVPDDPIDEMPILPSSEPPRSGLEQRNRSRMIEKVGVSWIKGVLEQSIRGMSPIALGLEQRSDAVMHPYEMAMQRDEQRGHSLLPGMRITDMFDQLGGELLILGAPGAGKTTMLLELTRDLLARAEQDMGHPIPVVFNLSSWATHRPPLSDWLVDELNMQYDIPRKVGQAWIMSDAVLPLLDGLDEVQQMYRVACVESINMFRQDHGLVSLVVCSRTDAYYALPTRLKLQSAVLIQPLTTPQIDAHLASVGDQLAALREAFHQDTVLQELAGSPLMLSIMSMVYHGLAIESLPAVESVERERNLLFDAYVDRMFQRRGAVTYYAQQQTCVWLAWLAQMMKRQGQSVFYIEQMQPAWLATGRLYQSYRIGVGLIVGLVFGLAMGLIAWSIRRLLLGSANGLAFGIADGLIVGLVFGLLFGWATGKKTPTAIPRSRTWRSVVTTSTVGLTIGFVVGLVVGLVVETATGVSNLLASVLPVGLVCGFTAGLIAGLLGNPSTIEIRETLIWSWSRAKVGLAIGLAVGLATGLVVGLVAGFTSGLADGLAEGLATMLVVIFAIGLATGATTGVVEMKTVPNEGIWRSSRNAARLGVAFGVVSGLVIGLVNGIVVGPIVGLALGLASVVFVGLSAALFYGGLACIQHLVLRLIVWRTRVMPWNYGRFLDAAVDRLFLRKVGGGYIFVHRLLLDYFYEQGLP